MKGPDAEVDDPAREPGTVVPRQRDRPSGSGGVVEGREDGGVKIERLNSHSNTFPHQPARKQRCWPSFGLTRPPNSG